MNAKKILLAAVVGGALLVPAGAFANHTGADCSYSVGDQQRQAAGPVVVSADADGAGGTSGTADQSAGVCTAQGTFEVGHSSTKGTSRSQWYGTGVHDGFYAVADGGSTNPDPGDGYVGVSNYETSTTPCTTPDHCSGSNSGGNVGAPGGPYAPTYVPVVCGNTTGPSWDNSLRDGCETS